MRVKRQSICNGSEDRVNGAGGPVIMLQGPVGRFFGALARQSQAAGVDIINVHFNLADRIFKSGGQNIVFAGCEDEFPGWLERLCREQKPSAILLFGDRRPFHIVACRVAETHSIPLYSFEEGYLRPDFVTFERGGNNARSSLPRQPSAYQPATVTEAPVAKVGQSFWSMTAAACGYFVVLRAGRWLFPHYRHHRERPLPQEALAWLRNVARKARAHRHDRAQQARLIHEKSKQFFIVALQVHDDLQAVHHGAGWSQERLIEVAIRSFSANAPKGTELALRCHPLDRGHRSYGELMRRVAGETGVINRVILMQSGHGPTLLMHAAGVVTVNSTMALSALHHGCPVYAVGNSFYQVPGLLAEGQGIGGMDAFWQHPVRPDPELVKAFAGHLRWHVLIPGSFYRRRHWPQMGSAVLQRLTADGVIGAATQPAEQSPHQARLNVARHSQQPSEGRILLPIADRPVPLPRPRSTV
jgi:capsular polysaccharide export protein